MPTHKKRLTRAEEREGLRQLSIMRAEGIQLELPDEWLEHCRLLDVVIAPSSDNQVVERASGGLNYEVWLRLRSRSRCRIDYAELTVPWDEQIVLDSPDEKDITRRFGPKRLVFQQVLNLRIENTLRFARGGEVVEGVILATGMSRLPDSYMTGQLVPFTISLYDQWGEAIVERGHLSVQRAGRHDRVPGHQARNYLAICGLTDGGGVAITGMRGASNSAQQFSQARP